MRFEIRPTAWLTVTTIAVAFTFVAATVFVTHTAANIDAMATDIAGNADPSIRHLSTARTELHALDDAVVVALMGVVTPEQLRRDVSAHVERLHTELELYETFPAFPDERSQWDVARVAVARAEDGITRVAARFEDGDKNGAIDLRTGVLGAEIASADKKLEGMVAFNAAHSSDLGERIARARRSADRSLLVIDAVALGLAVALVLIGKRATREFIVGLQRARDKEATMKEKLRAVTAGAITIAESLSRTKTRTDVFRVALDAACSVAGAEMAAAGVGDDPNVPFESFVSRGPAFVGTTPRPRGLLGAVVHEGRTIRVDDATRDPRFEGMPKTHAPIGPFLGVVIRHEGAPVGSLYLAKAPGKAPFTEQDANAVELLGTFAATALENESLYESLRRAVVAREDLLSIVSHDLRNPLSAVVMAATLMKRGATVGSPERAHAEIVARNAAKMDRMIADLLAAAKLREGKLAIEPKAVEVGPLFAEALDAFALAAEGKGIALSILTPLDLPAVFCDAARASQVLANLVGNALKFTPRGGTIVVSAKRLSDEEIAFSVRDTGAGIAADAREHVFDRFFQQSEHAARGTGLGLFIVKGIVESHGGRVWVESKLGDGSNFQFTLPVAGMQR